MFSFSQSGIIRVWILSTSEKYISLVHALWIKIHGHGTAKEIPWQMKEFSWFCRRSIFLGESRPSRHGPDFHRPQSQITIDSPDFHPRQSQKCLLGRYLWVHFSKQNTVEVSLEGNYLVKSTRYLIVISFQGRIFLSNRPVFNLMFPYLLDTWQHTQEKEKSSVAWRSTRWFKKNLLECVICNSNVSGRNCFLPMEVNWFQQVQRK